MPNRLFNTLKYGSKKTKRKLYLMIGTLAAGVLLLSVAVFFGNLLLGVAAAAGLFVDGLILMNTSFEQRNVSVNSPKRQKKGQKDTTEQEQKHRTAGENYLLQYDETEIKKLFVTYKVKKQHVPVLIDLCQAEQIVRRPAYLWNDANYLYFLILEEEPRLIKARRTDMDAIHIRRGVAARPMEEYPELNDRSVISMIFGGLLPKYYKVETNAYHSEYRKNMYSAASGIWCSSGSVKNLLKILPGQFVLDDGRYNTKSDYYQKIYIARVMYRDAVYSAQEYKEKVLEILEELIRAEIAEGIVTEYLNAMLSEGLIPREYAEYVITKRKAKNNR